MAATDQLFLLPQFKLEKFSGSGKQNARAWLQDYDRIAAAAGWNDIKRIDYLSLYLEGTAADWMRIYAKLEEKIWATVSKAFLKAFVSTQEKEQTFNKLLQRVLGPNESVASYYYDIFGLCELYDDEMTEADRL